MGTLELCFHTATSPLGLACTLALGALLEVVAGFRFVITTYKVGVMSLADRLSILRIDRILSLESWDEFMNGVQLHK